MQALLSLMIVAATAAAPSDARFPDAVEVYHCLFDESSDKNFDGWPDDWTRFRAAGYPQYISIGIADECSPAGPSSLRFELNGGPARVDSPQISIGTLFSYVLEAQVKTKGLKSDEAYFSVSIFNAKKKLLETHESQPTGGTHGWTKLRVGPIAPTHDDARYAVISLQVRPKGRPDLRGTVWFDDIWFAQVPRVTLTTNRRHNIYLEDEKPEITCRVSGFLDHEPNIQLDLIDVFGKTLTHEARRLSFESSGAASSSRGSGGDKSSDGRKPYAGTCTWSPPIPQSGFYKVRVTMPSRTAVTHRRELSLAVVSPMARVANGEFGWTVPRGEQSLPLGDFSELVSLCGIGRLKFPIWVSGQDATRIDQLSWFAERLNSDGVEIIGLLADPPTEVRTQMGEGETTTAAGIFSTDPKLWYPSLEPAITRLSLTVRWWQLGLDNDTSFVGYPKLAEKIEQVKRKLARFGQQVNMGIPWRWVNALPSDQRPPWSYLSLSSDPALTAEELGLYLDATDSKNAKRYVALEPLAANQYPLEVRAADLVNRLVAARIHKADSVFIPDLFDEQHGLMSPDGTVGELLLPWRTTTSLLSGVDYLGSLQLANGSSNAVFVNKGTVTMVVWNDRPQTEEIYQGEEIRQVDLWGRTSKLRQDGDRQLIEVGPSPTFVTGLSEAITRMQMSFAFSTSQLPSVFGRPQSNAYSLRNFFPQGVGGHVKLLTPDVWRTVPKEMNIKLAAGETLLQPIDITLPYDASSGRQRVRIDCEINGDRRYAFSIFRTVDIGVDDVSIEVSTHLRDDGDLEVEQRMSNQTDELVSFKCQLFAPDRRRMVSQVLDLGRSGDKKVYRFPNGAELVGKQLWLRAEEIGGQRILNYRFNVEK